MGSAAGTRSATLEIENGSSVPCRLSGRPTVQLLNVHGRVMPAAQRLDRSGAFGRIRPLAGGTVPPGGHAMFVVTIENDPAFRGAPWPAVLVALPGTRQAIRVPLSARGTDRVFDPSPDAGFSVTRIGRLP
ncbi:DUF4232 domain-containing protein [Paraconexibacter sp. AEG42_29]